MKKIAKLLLGGALCLSLLTGCAASQTVSHTVDVLKEDFKEFFGLDFRGILDFAGGYVTKLGGVDLPDPKMSEELTADLPQELNTITVDGETLNCQVTHLVVLDRETNETRQTDQVNCRVLLSGDGISADYQCTLYYTYTENGGWGLDDWSLDQDSVQITVDEGVLTEQLAQQTISLLETSYGEGNIVYLSSYWDGSSNICDQTFQVDGTNGVLLTQGSVFASSTLTLNLEEGLYYTWNITTDTTQVIRGADLTNTTWLCSGTVDNTDGAIAFHVDDFQMDTGYVVVTGATETQKEGGYAYDRTFTAKTVTWSNGENGSVTFTIESGSQSWECCFTADGQWVRMNGSYLDELTETTMPSDEDFKSLLQREAEEKAEQAKYSLEYSASETGKSYAATDGTVVYVQSVSYPSFTGNNADVVNDAVEKIIEEYLASPQMSTDKSNLDTWVEQAEEEDSDISLPISDELKISVEFDKNGYVSLLCTAITHDTSGKVSYSYEGEIYDLNTEKAIDYTEFITATGTQLGELLVQYGGSTFPYTAATAESYLRAVTLGNKGLIFHLAEEGEQAISVTIPYSESVYTQDPTETRTDLTYVTDTGSSYSSYYSYGYGTYGTYSTYGSYGSGYSSYGTGTGY